MKTIIFSLLLSSVSHAGMFNIKLPNNDPSTTPSYNWLVEKCQTFEAEELQEECAQALIDSLPALAQPIIDPIYPVVDFLEENLPEVEIPELDEIMADITGRQNFKYEEIKEEDYPKFN